MLIKIDNEYEKRTISTERFDEVCMRQLHSQRYLVELVKYGEKTTTDTAGNKSQENTNGVTRVLIKEFSEKREAESLYNKITINWNNQCEYLDV